MAKRTWVSPWLNSVANTPTSKPKYEVYGADRAGNCCTMRETDDPKDVLRLLAALRAEHPRMVFGVNLSDDPEAGDVEMDIEDALSEEEA